MFWLATYKTRKKFLPEILFQVSYFLDKTACEYAKEKGHWEIVEILQDGHPSSQVYDAFDPQHGTDQDENETLQSQTEDSQLNTWKDTPPSSMLNTPKQQPNEPVSLACFTRKNTLRKLGQV